MKVSLYIPAYNVEEHLANCVAGALAQTYPLHEILIIDDGSTDDTAEIASQLADQHATVKLIRHENNRGLAAARNTAIAKSRNEVVASLDADAVAEPTWLERLLPHLDDPNMAAVGGVSVESAIYGVADRFRRAFMSQTWGNRLRRNPPFLFGNNMVVRKSIVQHVGGYDPVMRRAGDDVDICNKFVRAGYATVYDPQAVVGHYRTDTIRSIFQTQWRWFSSATRLNVLRPNPVRSGLHFVFFFGQSAWRTMRHARVVLDPGVLLLNVGLPFYLTWRHMCHDVRRWRRG